MRKELDIKNRLEAESLNLSTRAVLYECAGDYERGWVAALKWVLVDNGTSEQAVQTEYCPHCGGHLSHGKCWDCIGDGSNRTA